MGNSGIDTRNGIILAQLAGGMASLRIWRGRNAGGDSNVAKNCSGHRRVLVIVASAESGSLLRIVER